MRKITICLALVFAYIFTSAQNGIKFEHKSFDEVCKIAKSENKLIFIDVYTQWCGPCLAMAEEIFTQPKVGYVVNKHFVSLKIDAENGEGAEIAHKYGVRSFPTYYFIDPSSQEVLHRSGGRHEADKFIEIVNNSMNPKLRSSYLEKEYQKGNKDPKFLLTYINYLANCYNRQMLPKVIAELISLKGNNLSDPVVGELFFEHINDRNHPLFVKFISERKEMEKVYGKEKTEDKIYKGYRWCRDAKQLEQLGDFKGKDYILTYNKLNILIGQKKYEAADKMIADMLANDSFDSDAVRRDIKFIARRMFYDKADKEWEQICLKYLQYIAYNSPDRQDAENHFNYAAALEKIIKENPEIHKYFPKSVTETPTIGKKEYDMRSPKLKQKPRYRRKK